MNFFEYFQKFETLETMMVEMQKIHNFSFYQIMATDQNWGLAKDGKLPWPSDGDQKWFREETLHDAVVVGRKTYETMPDVLDKRALFVLTSQVDGRQVLSIDDEPRSYPFGFTIFVENWTSLISELFQWGHTLETDRPSVYFAGGRSIYRDTLKHCDGIYHTLFQDDYECDIHYPCVDVLKENFTYDLPMVDFGDFQRRFYEPASSST